MGICLSQTIQTAGRLIKARSENVDKLPGSLHFLSLSSFFKPSPFASVLSLKGCEALGELWPSRCDLTTLPVTIENLYALQYSRTVTSCTRIDGGLLHRICYFIVEAIFVGVEGDGGQLVLCSWPCFVMEEEEDEDDEVEVSVLLTMCDLFLDCNNSALQMVRKEIKRSMGIVIVVENSSFSS